MGECDPQRGRLQVRSLPQLPVFLGFNVGKSLDERLRKTKKTKNCWISLSVLNFQEEKIEVLRIDNEKVRESQIAKLTRLRKTRDNVSIRLSDFA